MEGAHSQLSLAIPAALAEAPCIRGKPASVAAPQEVPRVCSRMNDAKGVQKKCPAELHSDCRITEQTTVLL